jgi:MFS family permease
MRVINANFTKLFYGQAISAIGDYVFETTLILWIGTRLLAGKDYAPAAVAGVLVFVSLGIVLVGPVAGVFVDRWDKRRTMMASDLIRAALAAGLGVVALLPAGTLPPGLSLALIYAVVLLSTATAQFFFPARFTLIGDIVEGDAARARAAGLTQTVVYIAAVVGPPLAAPLLFQTGPYWALFINAASFAVSFILVRAIRVPTIAPAPAAAVEPAVQAAAPAAGAPAAATEAAAPTPEPAAEKAAKAGFLSEFLSGVRFTASRAPVRALMISVTTVTLGAGALNALMVFFVTDNLHSKPDFFGTMGMGEGIGSVAGALLGAWICARIGDVRVLCYGLILGGVGVLVFARLDSLIPAIVTLAVLGIPLGALNVALTPIMLRAVPREYLGRIGGIITPVQYLASMVAALASGWLASTVMRNFHLSLGSVTFSRIDTIFSVAGVLVLAGGVYAGVALRGSRPTDPAPAPASEPLPTVPVEA